MHSRSSRNTGEAKRTKGYFLSIFPYFSQFILYIIINILHFAWYPYGYLWAFLHLRLRVGYGAGTGVGHSKFTGGWPMLITPAEECGCTRCAHCFFLSFCPPNSWITGTRRAIPPCHPHLGPFRTNWEGKPFVLRFVGWFRTDEKESLLLIVHVGAGLNQQEGKPFLLRFVGLLRRGNPSRHPYLFRPVRTNREGFPSLLGFWGHFEQRRGNPSCCPRFEPTGCVLLGHFSMPTIYFFFFSC